MQTDLKPELIFYAGNSLLEGPLWDDENGCLYFISIKDKMIYRFDEKTLEVESYPTESVVGALVLKEDGTLISAEKKGLYLIDPGTKGRTFLVQPNEDERLRYNDGKLDPKGRLLVGTMGYGDTYEGEACLFVVEKREHKKLLTGLTLSNGLGWSADGQTFYHIDTPTKKVKAYDYNLETAEVSNGRTVVDISGGGNPDGMCVDLDGHLWVAEYGGKRICKWDSNTGDLLAEIPMPVSNVTSCCIGGADKDYLYITTAQADDEPLSGGLFKVKVR